MGPRERRLGSAPGRRRRVLHTTFSTTCLDESGPLVTSHKPWYSLPDGATRCDPPQTSACAGDEGVPAFVALAPALLPPFREMKRQIFALLALLSAFVSASPGSFEVPIHRRAGTRSLASLQAGLASTRTKYGFRKALDRRRAVGTVAMVDYAADTMYLTSISIGGTTLEVMMDTGSAVSWFVQPLPISKPIFISQDLVVATLSCSSCDSTAARYDSTSSPSAVVSATNFSITYGTGSASGVLVQDIVAMGGFSVASQVRLRLQVLVYVTASAGACAHTSRHYRLSPLATCLPLFFRALRAGSLVWDGSLSVRRDSSDGSSSWLTVPSLQQPPAPCRSYRGSTRLEASQAPCLGWLSRRGATTSALPSPLSSPEDSEPLASLSWLVAELRQQHDYWRGQSDAIHRRSQLHPSRREYVLVRPSRRRLGQRRFSGRLFDECDHRYVSCPHCTSSSFRTKPLNPRAM